MPFVFAPDPRKVWVVDSGATTHMTWDKLVFVTYATMEDMPNVRLGDGRYVKAEGKGSVCWRIKDDIEAERVIRLSSVLFVPELSCNLFSVREHEVTVPDSPEMNGLTVRMNRTILEKAKCMCAHADLPKSLWAEAASTACYVYNHLPNAPLKCKSLHEVWYSRKPDLSNLRVFGFVAYALVPATKRKKFDNRTEKMRFLGYHKGHRGYKLMEKV